MAKLKERKWSEDGWARCFHSLHSQIPHGWSAMAGRIIWHISHAWFITAVKSNALAELMNRASKIHWKNLSLTLNGRNSETKNDKNNPKVPFFQYVQLFRNISFLLKWSFLAKICCCCQMCYFPKLSIFFKMCVVCKMFGLGHNVRFFQNGFLSKCMFLV